MLDASALHVAGTVIIGAVSLLALQRSAHSPPWWVILGVGVPLLTATGAPLFILVKH